MTDDQLLKGVTAKDKKDGDVTDSLTVETVYSNGEDSFVVVFAAKDSSNNITKGKFFMLSDGKAETEKEIEKETGKETLSEENTEAFVEESNEAEITPTPAAEETSAETPADTSVIDSNTPDNVSDESETALEAEAKKTQEDKIAELKPQDPKMYLSTYYVKAARGSALDELSYVKDIQDDIDATNELWRKIQVTGTVDMNTAGTYELTYFVVDSNGNMSNGAVLTVVVE